MSNQAQESSEGKSLIGVRPRGFCAGVVRAVDIVELALQAYGPPVYVHHEIVHNRYVVEQLRQAALRAPRLNGAHRRRPSVAVPGREAHFFQEFDELVELQRAELLDRLEQCIAGDLGLEVDRGHGVNPESRTSLIAME